MTRSEAIVKKGRSARRVQCSVKDAAVERIANVDARRAATRRETLSALGQSILMPVAVV